MMYEDLLKLAVSLLIGSLLGLEREYHHKPAGFRTIALICVGATMFTILSMELGTEISKDRIASNIVTGIGFIGAGVIYKTGISVAGLTTAATIWIAAALGMATGTGNYTLACSGLCIALLVLALFERIQDQLHLFHERRIYTIATVQGPEMLAVEAEMKSKRLTFKRLKEKRSAEELSFQYEVTGRAPKMRLFEAYLLQHKGLVSYEY